MSLIVPRPGSPLSASQESETSLRGRETRAKIEWPKTSKKNGTGKEKRHKKEHKILPYFPLSPPLCYSRSKTLDARCESCCDRGLPHNIASFLPTHPHPPCLHHPILVTHLSQGSLQDLIGCVFSPSHSPCISTCCGRSDPFTLSLRLLPAWATATCVCGCLLV